MSPLDIQLINRKIKLIEADLTELKKHSAVNAKEYMVKLELQLPVERLLERIIGRLTDINYHLLREKHGYLPNDYFDSFVQMGVKNEISHQLARKLAKSTGLRNVLAHEYDEVNHQQVYKSIKLTLIEVPRYLKEILAKLSK